ALGRLPEDYRRGITPRHEEQLSFEEIGRLLQRSPDAARELWARGLERVHEGLDPPWTSMKACRPTTRSPPCCRRGMRRWRRGPPPGPPPAARPSCGVAWSVAWPACSGCRACGRDIFPLPFRPPTLPGSIVQTRDPPPTTTSSSAFLPSRPT